MKTSLSATRQSCFLSCQRKYYWRYEIGFARAIEADALRFGSAWHRAMEARWAGKTPAAAFADATGNCSTLDEFQLAMLAGMLEGYFSLYQNEIVDHVHPEVRFCFPLRGSRAFYSTGSIDGLGTLHDGRICMVEHKTAGEDIGPGSDYWLRLNYNPQIFEYVIAARRMKWNINVVIYDVARKPAIRQKNGETADEFRLRLAADTKQRPEFYFARREVPIFEDALAEYQETRLALARAILYCRKAAKNTAMPERFWLRNMDAINCRRCDYSDFCLQGIAPKPTSPPAGFTRKEYSNDSAIA